MTSATTFQIDSIHGRTVVAFLPPLNEIPWAEIEKVGGQILPRLQDSASPGVLVDLCSLKYMGSASLALVVRIYKTVSEKKGRMIVANKDPMVGEVLAKAGLEKIWEIAPSREEGLRRLGLPAGEAMRQAGGWQSLLAMVGLVVSAVGVAGQVTAMGLPGNLPLGLLLGGGAIAFGSALWALVSAPVQARPIAAILLVLSLAALMFGAFKLGQSAGAAEKAPVPPAAVQRDFAELTFRLV